MIIALTGIDNAPFYLFGVLAFNFTCVGVPIISSFHTEKVSHHPLHSTYICGRIESAIQVFVLILFPSSFYFAIYYRVFFWSGFHISTFFILLALPILFLKMLSLKFEVFWWTSKK